MNNPAQFYQSQLAEKQKERDLLKNQLNLSSTIRLIVFLLTGFGVYLALGNAKAIVAILILGIVAFLFLVTRHSKLQYKRNLVDALIEINQTELKVLKRDFHDLPDGKKYLNPVDFYSQDIDLFGRGSFFQYANRTALEPGALVLANLFTSNNIIAIPEKQKAIQELAELATWRQRFSGIARLVDTEVASETVVNWLKDYQSFIPKKAKIASRVFSLISILAFVLYFTDFIPGWAVFAVFLSGIAISGRFVKRVSSLSNLTGKAQSTFDQYHKLLSEIEGQEFSCITLSRKRETVITNAQSASSILRTFSKHLDALDQRNNVLIGIIANGFFLRDIAISADIEKWISSHKNEVGIWFEAIAFFDAYNSLGNYAFNHPSHSYPTITDDGNTLKSKGASHPLLNPEIAIKNDFTINREQFFIITGANMAGKSTFLRTVALHIVMGNLGLPVCADEASYTPIKLITSMRTTDSLTDDESYFFSELKRLKFIVDEIENDRYFIILDEILKGTNSTDKAIGSRKFVDKLVHSKATGIIATHDLSLCAAADELPQVENHFFDARIENDELYFDYTFKPGICQNMNASFLLKKMEIVE
jgi:ABC-type multidrug transport system fused ATPase/permease subunit